MGNKLQWVSIPHVANLLRPEMEMREARARGNAILKARAEKGDELALEKLKRRKVRSAQATSIAVEKTNKRREPKPPKAVETLQRAKNKLIGLRTEMMRPGHAYQIGIVIKWLDNVLEDCGAPKD